LGKEVHSEEMMRKSLTGIVTLALGLALVSPVAATAVDDVNTKRLRNAVTVNGILQHERALQRIANENNGTRASGTPGYQASVDYVAGKLRKAGYSVKIQEFTFPFFEALAPAELAQVTPAATDYATATFQFSGTGTVTGQLVATTDISVPPSATPSSTSGCEASDFPTAPTGPSVALIQRGTCNFGVKVANATAAGYDAVIIFNEGQAGRQELLTGTLGTPPATVPVVGLDFASGAALYQAAQAGPVTVRVATSTRTDLAAKTYNVLADTRKGKNSDQTVVVGAHLDSVVEGPGINDNGSGTAGILEIAEQMSALKYNNKLQRRVRFAFWGAEESGLLGSTHYVESLTDTQREQIYANLNFDMIGSPNYVRFVYDGDGSANGTAGPVGSEAIEKIFTDYFAMVGLASEPTEFDGRSDYGPFIDAGIPAGGLFSGAEGIKTAEQAVTYGGTAGQAYDPCYHQACDTISNLSSRALFELGDAAAHAVLTLARSKQGLYADASRLQDKAARKAGKLSQSGPALAR
jgi:Zn-dependent M28 family amino/carboxypeptidase